MTFHFPPDSAMRQRPSGHQSDVRNHGQVRRLLRLLPLLFPFGVMALRHSGRLRQALDQSAYALHDAEERFYTLLNQAPVGICQTNLSGCFLLANNRYCALLGRGMDTLRTLHIHELTHPEDRDRHRAGHARMLATGEPFVIEKRLLRPDESDVWVVSHMSVTHDAQGRPQHIIAAVQDISHRRAAEAALQAVNATLEQRVADAVAKRIHAEDSLRQSQRMEALGQLAGGVAHDFNNVLQAIAGGARLIQRRPDNPDTVRRLAGLVVDAADRGASVTRRLLSFARRGSLQPGPVDAAPLLDDLREMLARTLGSGITVQASAEADLPPMMADKDGLETVLVNLATNARDAMLDETGLPRAGANRVGLHAARDDGAPGRPPGPYVRLEVTDSGLGMDRDTLAHAVEPFFTTKPRGRGTGLGLSVARGFVDQSGGQLAIQSVPGQGTTVQIWLPAIIAAALPVRADTRPVVVLVDDDVEVRDVLADTLASHGCRVSGYADAASALARIADDTPDLLISDLSMPGTDGMTLIRQARLLRPGLAAILLTGHSGPELEAAVEKMAGGRVILVQKPVQGAALAAQVGALLPEGVSLKA